MGPSSAVGAETVQSHYLGTAKSSHLTDEETKTQREGMSHWWSASPSGSTRSTAQVSACPAPVWLLLCTRPPAPFPGGLERIVCPLFQLVGTSTCPLLGLGNALTCPLLELVGACLAFVQIGQLSMTFQTKGRIMVVTGAQERKVGAAAERGFTSLAIVFGQSGQEADMADEA